MWQARKVWERTGWPQAGGFCTNRLAGKCKWSGRCTCSSVHGLRSQAESWQRTEYIHILPLQVGGCHHDGLKQGVSNVQVSYLFSHFWVTIPTKPTTLLSATTSWQDQVNYSLDVEWKYTFSPVITYLAAASGVFKTSFLCPHATNLLRTNTSLNLYRHLSNIQWCFSHTYQGG